MWKRKKRWKPKTVTSNPPHSFRLACILSFCVLLVFFFVAPGPSLVPPASAAPGEKKLKPTDPYALIFGTVWGPDNRAVYGITVKIRRSSDKEKKARWEVYSDHSGEFAQRVPAGTADYVVWADLKGVKTTYGVPLHLVEPVDVHIDNDERVDIGLHLSK
jgi:hypothetical protein